VKERLQEVARTTGAELQSPDFREVVGSPQVDCVIVSTGEAEHYGPTLYAIEQGKPVLVEKPLTLDLAEARDLIQRAGQRQVPVFVGYTQRFRRRFLNVKEKLQRDHLGRVESAVGRIYVTSAVARTVLSRAPYTSPSLNTLTYQLDMLLWFLEGVRPARAYAQSVRREFQGRSVPWGTWAVITMEDGTVVDLGVSWQLPERYPAYVATMHLELFGQRGVLAVDDSHREVVLVSDEPVVSPYTPEVSMNVAYLESAMPGDVAVGRFWGPMKTETEAFVESVRTGRAHPVLADGDHGYRVLELSLAIDQSAASGQVVELLERPGASRAPAAV